MSEHDASEQNESYESRHRRIGERLKAARKSRRLDIADVSRSLRLPGITVEDIEAGRLDRLAGLYRRGYVANYARLVGVDPGPLLADLEPDVAPTLRRVLPQSRTGRGLDRYLKYATYVIVTTAIVPPLLILLVQGGSRIADQELRSDVSAEQISVPASSEEQRMARRIARALALDEKSEVETSGPVTASALPIRSLRPVRELQPEPVAATELAALVGTDEDDAALPLVLDLRLELLDDSWIEIYAADGRRLEYDLLRAGQSRGYQGEPPFRLLLGRANAVRLVADGKTLEFPGDDRADVVSLKLLPGGEVRR